ncbi:ionotropic receptor 21a-like [Penaeus japonicus]|uniref:ionotropic receptor 21a-like n=1 Tax=Penaeus japonicus TaxID=27405 RepID=UPI001C715B34|nr:ionotropic receptor 21a-like [Penaeus japonicus]
MAIVVVSDDLTFLTTFAERSQKGRLLTWTTRLLLVTRMTSQKLRYLMTSHWTFSKMNVVFLNLGKSRKGGRRYSLYSHLPYTPEGPKMVEVGTWTPESSLRLRGPLFQEKYSNFYGAQVNVTSQTWIPQWKESVIRSPDGTEVTKYSGMDYQAIVVIAEVLNFTVNIIPTATFAEAVAKLEEGVSSILTMAYSIIPERLERHDFTRAVGIYRTTFAMANPKPQPSWYSLFYPLSREVWLSILAALAITSLVLRLLTYFGGDQYPSGSYYVTQEIYKILLGQDLVQHFSKTTASRLLFAGWLVFSLIIGVAYKSNLTTCLTLPEEPPRIETIQQLVGGVERILMPSYGKDWVNFYRNSDSKIYRTLGEKIHIGSGMEEELSRLKHNQAVIGTHLYLDYVIAKNFTDVAGRRKFYIGKSYLLTSYSAWPISYDTPYKQQLDKYLLALIESGLFIKWQKDIFGEAEQENLKAQRKEKSSEEAKAEESRDKALTIKHFQGPLLLLVLGLVAAGVTFSVELIFKCSVFGFH